MTADYALALAAQAAALVIAKPLAGAAGFSDRAVDVRVDDHRTPIPELRRVYNCCAPTRS